MEGTQPEQSALDLTFLNLKQNLYILMESVVFHDHLTLTHLKLLLLLEFLQLSYFILSPFNDHYFYHQLTIVQYVRPLLQYFQLYTNFIQNHTLLLISLYCLLILHIFVFIILYKTYMFISISTEKNKEKNKNSDISINNNINRLQIISWYIHCIHTFGCLPIINTCLIILYCQPTSSNLMLHLNCH